MRHWLLAATAIYLAACSAPEEQASGAEAGDPGTYTRNLPDGTAVALVIREDGTLIRSAGNQKGAGTARKDGDRLCFTFYGEDDGEYCWTNGPIRPGGTFESTSDDGETLIITYSPEIPPKGAEMTPGTYEVGDETTAYGRTQINADGTYVDFVNDEAVGGGTWSVQGERACFDPEGNEDHQLERCWINDAPDVNGRFLTSREDGSQAYFVTPIKD